MAQTSNFDPGGFFMLALLGIGAYVLVTRQATAKASGKQPFNSSPTQAIIAGAPAHAPRVASNPVADVAGSVLSYYYGNDDTAAILSGGHAPRSSASIDAYAENDPSTYGGYA